MTWNRAAYALVRNYTGSVSPLFPRSSLVTYAGSSVRVYMSLRRRVLLRSIGNWVRHGVLLRLEVG